MPDEPSPQPGRRRSFRATRTSAALRALAPAELIKSCLRSDDGSWEEFLRRYANLIYSTILKVDLPDEDQEDAFQTTVLAIYTDLGKLRSVESLTSWIVGISYRQAINRIRRRTRARETALEEGDEGDIRTAIDPPDPAVPPDEVQSQLQRAQQVAEALDLLPERCRRLLQILFFEDPSPDYGEISRREGVPIGSIGPTRARCLDKMRRVFEERGWLG